MHKADLERVLSERGVTRAAEKPLCGTGGPSDEMGPSSACSRSGPMLERCCCWKGDAGGSMELLSCSLLGLLLMLLHGIQRLLLSTKEEWPLCDNTLGAGLPVVCNEWESLLIELQMLLPDWHSIWLYI